jgi:hypothetical protein
MTADEKLARIRAKIQRANKHFRDLETVGQAFFATNPYLVAAKRDPQTNKPVYYMDSVAPVPIEYALIAGDVIHNLRVALDHLARQLFLVGPDGRENAEVNFPFRNNATQYQSFVRGQVQTFRQDAIEKLLEVEAHKGGKGHELWVLNRLNNIDKHRLIVTVGSSYGGVGLWSVMARGMKEIWEKMSPGQTIPIPDKEIFLNSADKLCPLKAGDELFIDVADAEIDEKIKFRFGIAFNEPGVIEAKPVLETLKHFGELVSTTVEAFKPCLS